MWYGRPQTKSKFRAKNPKFVVSRIQDSAYTAWIQAGNEDNVFYQMMPFVGKKCKIGCLLYRCENRGHQLPPGVTKREGIEASKDLYQSFCLEVWKRMPRLHQRHCLPECTRTCKSSGCLTDHMRLGVLWGDELIDSLILSFGMMLDRRVRDFRSASATASYPSVSPYLHSFMLQRSVPSPNNKGQARTDPNTEQDTLLPTKQARSRTRACSKRKKKKIRSRSRSRRRRRSRSRRHKQSRAKRKSRSRSRQRKKRSTQHKHRSVHNRVPSPLEGLPLDAGCQTGAVSLVPRRGTLTIDGCARCLCASLRNAFAQAKGRHHFQSGASQRTRTSAHAPCHRPPWSPQLPQNRVPKKREGT